MTTQSFINYKEHIEYGIYFYATKVNILYSNGSMPLYHQMALGLLIMYYELLNDYTLIVEEVSEDDYVDNMLVPRQMNILSQFTNRLLNINYIVDFILTSSDVFGSIPTFSFPGTNEAEVAETKQTIL